ncbi:MAG: branched-chain amino acid ABC transporter permease [Ilumatobacteraceae bacterium]
MPIRLRERSLAHRVCLAVAWLFVIVPIVYVPFATKLGFIFGSVDKASRIGQLNTVIAFAVAILGLNIVIGFAGQLALGQSAFIGLGAYTTVILVADHHWSYLSTLPISAGICFVAGLLVGVPATRVKGVYLAIMTLVLAFVFPAFVLRFGWLTGGPNGKGPPRRQGKLFAPSWMPFADTGRLAGPLWIYSLLVVIAAALFLLARNGMRSRPGRALITMRDHEPSATALGVNVALYKALAFGFSALYGGLAGSMLMMNRPFAIDVDYGTKMSIFLVAGLVVGGAGAISGAVPSAFVYIFVPYLLTEWTFDQSGLPWGIRQITRPLFVLLEPAGGDASGIFFGVALIVLTLVLPGGFVSGMRAIRSRLVTIDPNPSWRPRPDGSGDPTHAGTTHEPVDRTGRPH